MVYREHGMWEILEVLRRAHRGEKLKAISRSTGRSRNTVKRFLAAAEELGWRSDSIEPDERLAAGVLAKLRPGPRIDSPGETEQLLLQHRETLRAWLQGDTEDHRPLTLTKCHDLLSRRGVKVTYSSLDSGERLQSQNFSVLFSRMTGDLPQFQVSGFAS